VLTTIKAYNPTTQSHDVPIDTGRLEGPARQPSAQEEAFTTDAAVPSQDPHQQIEDLEDAMQDSEEEIEAVVEDELACLRQENERLRLVQEQMIRRREVMKRAQIM
jgi:predicted RNase H-like HicB family nuclease